MVSAHPYTPRRISNDFFGIDVGLRGNALLAVITASCASGFLLVGYDNGVMGGLVNGEEFKRTFNTNDANTLGNIVSLYEIGCFFGALATFVVGDYLGRRRTILISSIFMVAGAIIQAACNDVGVMIAGRIISGLGMGAINSTVPVLQAETAPATSRGKLAAVSLTILNVGIVLSYWIDYAFAVTLTGNVIWRVPIALQCVFIGGLVLATLIIPETPRWLAKKGRHEEAIAVLERLHNASIDSPEVQQSYAGIQQALEHERAASNTGWSFLVKEDSIRSRRRLLLACFIQAAQQLSGINALIYYSGTLFAKSVRLSDAQSAVMAGGLNMCLILGSTISYFLIDRVGRKALLIPCIAGMSAVMCVQTGLVKVIQEGTGGAIYGRAAAAMLFVFEFFFSLGFQATVWLIPSEVLPLLIRTKGSALSTASNWIFNFAIVKFTPSALDNIGWKTYIIFAVLNAAWVPIIYFFLPETANRTLEEMDEIFAKDNWQIDQSHAAADTKAAAHRNTDMEYADDTGSNKGSYKNEQTVTSTLDR
ncbi:General substrate transporter [Kalmanozyma brasiliensis GHG001]|uniref:Sugar transporter n=1 Tax=Kalmanozyma brasiliensis (strain GHG001) TaxID=1365824 RepID=V5EXT9_KALBG|nr:General substrate transporter [Kalmanozyma brasiliensis GHG001]EST08403.1 General substrate transporter [Kalmanozyma brasiliensis GHG001]